MQSVQIREELSVVFNVFNGSPFVNAWVEDVTKLLKLGVQVILVLDAPTDSTAMDIESSLGRDSNILIVTLEKNVGAASARNIGLSYCDRKFVSFFDFDDRIIVSNLLAFFSDFRKSQSDVGVANFGWKLKESRQEILVHLDDYIQDPNYSNLKSLSDKSALISAVLPWPAGVWRMCFSVEYLRIINARWFPTYEDLGSKARISEDIFFLTYVVINNPELFFWDRKDIIYLYGFCNPAERSYEDFKLILVAMDEYLSFLDARNFEFDNAYLAQFVMSNLWSYLPMQEKKTLCKYLFSLVVISVKVIKLKMNWLQRLKIMIEIIPQIINSSKRFLVRIMRFSRSNMKDDTLAYVRNYLSV